MRDNRNDRQQQSELADPVVAAIDWWLANDVLPLGREHPCPYLPDRTARMRGFQVEHLSQSVYLGLMNRGFRRSGKAVYQPQCADCRECRQIRVPVQQFVPTRSMRRVFRRNRDLTVTVGPPAPTDEKYALYRSYLQSRHHGNMDEGPEAFRRFLYDSPMTSLEFCYWAEDRLMGFSIADDCGSAMSSVYMCFHPDAGNRSLGVYSVIREIQYCQEHEIDYYYLGFYIKNCKAMAYKANYRPNQVLDDGRRWLAGRSPSSGDDSWE